MTELEKLAIAWDVAKRKEQEATEQRVAIENEIIALHPAKEEGSETITEGLAKITLTGKLIYKADIDKLTALTGAWPAEIRPIKTKIEADDSKLKAIRSERPDLWRAIAGAIETKPAKTGVKITFAP